MWAPISRLPDSKFPHPVWQVGNSQYSTNLRGFPGPAMVELDTRVLTFYTLNVIKLTTPSRAESAIGAESREGEDKTT